MRVAGLFVLMCAAAMGQQASPKKTEYKPFALNVGVAEKYSFVKRQTTITPQATLDYRFFANRLRVGVTYSYGIETKDRAISGSMNVKVFEFGRR